MALINSQRASVSAGVEIAWTNASSGGDEVPCGGGRILLVRNGHSAAQTATVSTPGTVRGIAIGEVAESITENGGVWVLPLTDEFRNSVGRANITYSGVTALQVAVIEPDR
ncbi:hypothetical protein BBK82_05010 [Lentzea guizhouensis]|uniref:Uncharacterized protein n=1 Tax=Lentzea guizhouensis TaxID=1586287 RepID=A0A1B2HCU1_9PSEU|nr:hypothetical protein [Lentzea guizhouensis]ANZ35533.1 hypothetical protein BBK82_05010 [Lentzea guizhouensis]